MTKPWKLLKQLLSSNRGTISFRDFEHLLHALGFRLDRITGSHRQYVHPDVPRSFPVQPDGKDAKRYQLRELLDMIAEYGLGIDDE